LFKKKSSYYEKLKDIMVDFMSKKITKKAEEFRDKIPELEGLLIGKKDGDKIWGDTLVELNHEFILSSASVALRAMKKVSEATRKEDVHVINGEMEGGYISIIAMEKTLTVAFYGEDARTQKAIIVKNLKQFAQKIDKLL
jgi:predicted regulator of Ras-like GTPase activity (Roadblock/LC7/MglB family)